MRRSTPVRVVTFLLTGLVLLTAPALMTPVLATPALATSTSSALTTSAATSATKTPGGTKTPSVTFGLGPANAKQVDGRAYFAYFVAPGGQVTDHVALVNLSAQALPLQLYVSDATNSSNGSLGYAAQQTKPTDAGSWFALATPSHTTAVVLAPRSTIIVPIDLRVPASASPGDHLAAFVLSLNAISTNKNGQRVTLDQRVAAKAFVRVSGPLHPKLTIQNLTASYDGALNPIGDGTVTVAYEVKNSGNVDLGIKQKVSVSGLFGSTGTAGVPAAVSLLLPGGVIEEKVTVKHVQPQLLMHTKVSVTTTPVADLVSPALPPVTVSTTLWAIPWTLIGIVVLIALVLSGWVWWRRRPTDAPPLTPESLNEPLPVG